MNPLSEFFNKKNNASQSNYGDDTGATKEAIQTGLLADLKGMGTNLPKDAMTIIEALSAGLSGEPIDDKKLMVPFPTPFSFSSLPFHPPLPSPSKSK